MKKILFALLLAVQSLGATEATAAPCVTATLASYVSLGAGGCTIGNLLFTDFSLNPLSTGATDFPGIVLNPVDGGMPGLDFTFTTGASDSFLRAAAVTATGGKIYEDRIGFKISAPIVKLNSSTITLNGARTADGGNVTTVQDLCIGGTFVSPAYSTLCSPGSTAANQIVFVEDFGDMTTSTLAFAPVMTLSVINDILVDAGVPGSTAMLASLSSRFGLQPNVVPEPAPLLLIGAGLMALLMRRASRRERSMPIA